MASHVNQSSFPEYILVTFGSSFPSTKGFYGLVVDSPMVLKRASIAAAEVFYTETGSLTASVPTAYPTEPSNRIKLIMIASSTPPPPTTVYRCFLACSGMRAASTAWTGIDQGANSAHTALGWGTKNATINRTLFNSGDVTYTFLDVWNNPAAPTAFKGGTLATLEEYFPDVEVTHGSGGDASTSNSAPRIGDTITLTASPNNGYRFVNWINDGTELSRDSTYLFTVPFIDAGETYSIRANFEKVTRIMDFRINGIAADLS